MYNVLLGGFYELVENFQDILYNNLRFKKMVKGGN